MWRRRSNLPGNPDSDQSISEEDEEHVNDVCPSEETKEEGGLLLQTKLQKLIGCGEVDYDVETGNVSPEATKISSSLEDDVEVPDSLEESYIASGRKAELTCISAQENMLDYEIPQDEPVATWSTVSKETESMIHLNGVASVLSSHSAGFRAKRGSKVVEDHVKPKFSFHSHSHGETSSKICDMAEHLEHDDDMAIEEDPIAECPHDFDEISETRLGVTDMAIEEDPIADSPHDFDEISENRQDITDMAIEVQNRCIEEAISKLVDNPTEKIRVAKRSSKTYRRREGRRSKFAHKGSSSIVQDSATDDELPGPMDSGSSTDDEANYQISVPNISNQKKQFVGDRFDEAIKASSLSKEGLLFGSPKLSGGSSLYGKLQQIMKQEKETEMEITKKFQGGFKQADGSSYVDVRILSTHLEAKLVVCKCSIIDLSGDSLLAKESETTIIFSPKVCVDVYIEIGSFIRLYAPWKEMEMKNTNEVIILSSYFSTM
ncbi:hypothetical protein AALP_AA1G022900 [Arabis alpina]|uniref:Uncharacterized protein n=1 Tax=Arabis alpina TaxID=50452 RepID=A0A087HKK4_ARAAL|nr:hypothetical protein AALP_AA1G022900 [Arabis alpina]